MPDQQRESLISYIRSLKITNYRTDEFFEDSNGVITITVTIEN